jgi:hypothetical protein
VYNGRIASVGKFNIVSVGAVCVVVVVVKHADLRKERIETHYRKREK